MNEDQFPKCINTAPNIYHSLAQALTEVTAFKLQVEVSTEFGPMEMLVTAKIQAEPNAL